MILIENLKNEFLRDVEKNQKIKGEIEMAVGKGNLKIEAELV